jgi:hypothetical protein
VPEHFRLLMAQRAYALQPRVAVSATLGSRAACFVTATRLRLLHGRHQQSRRNRLAVDKSIVFFPRVAETATLGWRVQPRWGCQSAVQVSVSQAGS